MGGHGPCRNSCAQSQDEENEIASMVLEWIGRAEAEFSSELKQYLFSKKPNAHQ